MDAVGRKSEVRFDAGPLSEVGVVEENTWVHHCWRRSMGEM